MLFHILLVLHGEERYFQHMCAGIGQDVMLSIRSGWCDVGDRWNVC